MKALKVAGILTLSSMMLLPAMGVAGSCKNVDVRIDNHTGGEIKIKKIHHKDYGKGKWRTNIATNRNLPDGYRTTYTKDLQYVKGEDTKVAVLYHQYDLMIDRWAYSPKFHCTKNDVVLVDITEPGTMAIFERPPHEGRPVAVYE